MRLPFLSVVVLCLAVSTVPGVAVAQPRLPKERIATDVRPELRSQVEGLYSEGPFERACAAFLLGQQGEKAVDAVPFLAALLADGEKSYDRKMCRGYVFNLQGFVVSPGRSAAEALAEMGPVGVRALVQALDDKDSVVQFNAELGVIRLQDFDALDGLLKHERSIVRRHTLLAIEHLATTSRRLAPGNAKADYRGKYRTYGYPPGTYVDPRLVGDMITALSDEDERVRQILAALRAATGQNFGCDPAAWKTWWEKTK